MAQAPKYKGSGLLERSHLLIQDCQVVQGPGRYWTLLSQLSRYKGSDFLEGSHIIIQDCQFVQ